MIENTLLWSKYFIFTKMTVLSAVVAFIFAYSLQKSVSDSSMAGFILLGVVAYVALIMSGYTGKWESELKNPYIFLIPDDKDVLVFLSSLSFTFKIIS